jgi:hypothetical protein
MWHRQRIGPNACGGDTKPATKQLCPTPGFIAPAFGLFAVGAALWRWLAETKRLSGLSEEAGPIGRCCNSHDVNYIYRSTKTPKLELITVAMRLL